MTPAASHRPLTLPERQALEAERRGAADEAREGYDFGGRVAAMNGWEFTSEVGESVWRSPVFVEDGENSRADSAAVTFAVTFAARSARVLDAASAS